MSNIKNKTVTIRSTTQPGKSEAMGKPVVKAKKKHPYDPTDNKGRGYRNVWEVYPDYWLEKWGPKPLLGYVRADDEFGARYAAYDKGLLIQNWTFEPEIRKATKFVHDI